MLQSTYRISNQLIIFLLSFNRKTFATKFYSHSHLLLIAIMKFFALFVINIICIPGYARAEGYVEPGQKICYSQLRPG